MKKFINELSFKKSFRIVAFFIGIIGIVFGGVTLCKLLFEPSGITYWDGTVASSFASGTGTSSNPYIVNTPEQFARIESACTSNVYIKLNNDIYLNRGYIEYINKKYKISIENNVYNLDPETGEYFQGSTVIGTLKALNINKNSTACHIDGNQHKVFGLYVSDSSDAAFLYDFKGTIDDFYVQSGLIYGTSASFIKNNSSSTITNLYFDAVLGTKKDESSLLYTKIKNSSLGSSSTINYNVSSQYAENNYNSQSGYAYRAGVYKLDGAINTYFYRGSVTDNNVLFGGYCWKIIRTTDTGGVRMIYNGAPSSGKCTATGTNTQISSSTYANPITLTQAYLGYTANPLLATESDSNVKAAIDTWYSQNLTSYSDFIEDSPYCNERATVTYKNTIIGSSTTTGTWYAAAARAGEDAINVAPSVDCSSSDYKYTVSAAFGNGKLTYPIATINADEVALAGGTSLYSASNTQKSATMKNNSTYYLYNGQSYWTMSPTLWRSGIPNTANMAYVNAGNHISNLGVKTSSGIRPVITLKNAVKVSSGTGTTTSPYVINSMEVSSSSNNFTDYIINNFTVTDTTVIDHENNGTSNYRYIGKTPNNYVCLGGTTTNCSDGEIYRMIGVFGEDTHGQEGKQLIKLIRSTPLTGKYDYDDKGPGVGSNDNESDPSSDWSDAQIMYMLNGTHYLNSGYNSQMGVEPIHNWQNIDGKITDGTTNFYTVRNSYYDGGGVVNLPASVSRGTTNYTSATRTIPGLNAKGRQLIEEVRWNTGLLSQASMNSLNVAGVYNLERNAEGKMGRPSYWIGKVGFISGSDFMYGTAVDDVTPRATCLAQSPNDYGTMLCDINNNWLSNAIGLGILATPQYNYYFMNAGDNVWGGGIGTTPKESVWGYDTGHGLDILWYLVGTDWQTYPNDYYVFPSVYLKDNTIFTGGTGTSTSPYILDSPPEGSDDIIEGTGIASLINTSSGSTYNTIKVEGNFVSDGSSTGLIYTSNRDTINNFQISTTLTSYTGNLFIGSATNTTTLTNGYFKGNLNTENTRIYDATTVKYTRVFATGNSNGPITYACNGSSSAYKVFESIDSGNSCYKTREEIKSSMNSGFSSTNWIINSSKEPELKVSGDTTTPGILLEVKNNANNTTYSYNSNTTPGVKSITNSFTFTVTGATDNTAIKEVGYYVAGSTITNFDNIKFINYSVPITINEQGAHIIYIKVTDINNNVTYINSDYFTNVSFTRTRIDGNTLIIITPVTLDHTTDPIVDTYYFEGTFIDTRKLSVKTEQVPAGTVLSIMYNKALYQYVYNGTETYVPLTAFTKAGPTPDIHFDEEIDFPFSIEYDFTNTSGGSFQAQLVMQDGNNDVITTTMVFPTTTILPDDVNSVTLSNSIGTIPINTISSRSISYTATQTRVLAGFYYLRLKIMDSNNHLITTGPTTGITVTYNNTKYYAGPDGSFAIPIGDFVSPMNLTFNVDYLNSVLLPGTYRVDAVLYNEYGTSNTSSFNITTDYMQTYYIKKFLLIDENTYTQILDREEDAMTLTFTVKTQLQDTIYETGNITTKVALEKKESLSSDSYSTVNINNYLSSSSQLLNGYNNVYPLGEAVQGYSNTTYNFLFNKANTVPGAYRLKLDMYANGYDVKTQYVYFIVK